MLTVAGFKAISLMTALFSFSDTRRLVNFPFLLQFIHATRATTTFRGLRISVASCVPYENTCEPQSKPKSTTFLPPNSCSANCMAPIKATLSPHPVAMTLSNLLSIIGRQSGLLRVQQTKSYGEESQSARMHRMR
jgi:hypothetical protein